MKLDPLHAGEPFLLCLVIAQSVLAGGLGGSPPQGLALWIPARVLENVAPELIFSGDILGLLRHGWDASNECWEKVVSTRISSRKLHDIALPRGFLDLHEAH